MHEDSSFNNGIFTQNYDGITPLMIGAKHSRISYLRYVVAFRPNHNREITTSCFIQYISYQIAPKSSSMIGPSHPNHQCVNYLSYSCTFHTTSQQRYLHVGTDVFMIPFRQHDHQKAIFTMATFPETRINSIFFLFHLNNNSLICTRKWEMRILP